MLGNVRGTRWPGSGPKADFCLDRRCLPADGTVCSKGSIFCTDAANSGASMLKPHVGPHVLCEKCYVWYGWDTSVASVHETALALPCFCWVGGCIIARAHPQGACESPRSAGGIVPHCTLTRTHTHTHTQSAIQDYIFEVQLSASISLGCPTCDTLRIQLEAHHIAINSHLQHGCYAGHRV